MGYVLWICTGCSSNSGTVQLKKGEESWFDLPHKSNVLPLKCYSGCYCTSSDTHAGVDNDTVSQAVFLMELALCVVQCINHFHTRSQKPYLKFSEFNWYQIILFCSKRPIFPIIGTYVLRDR